MIVHRGRARSVQKQGVNFGLAEQFPGQRVKNMVRRAGDNGEPRKVRQGERKPCSVGA